MQPGAPPGPTEGPGPLPEKRRAVIVGCNASQKGSAEQSLQWAVNDAQEIYDELTDSYTGSFDPVDVQLFNAATDSSKDIIQALRAYSLDSREGDLLLVYFAGHGATSKWLPSTDALLVTADLDVDAVRLDPTAGLRISSLRNDVLELTAATTVLILDCCHAGSFTVSPIEKT